MKIFKRIKNWLFPSDLPLSTLEQLEDLLYLTLTDLSIVINDKSINKNFHLAFDEKKQFINAWFDNRYCPISFKITTLLECRNNARRFIYYIRIQLRKAGVEC